MPLSLKQEWVSLFDDGHCEEHEKERAYQEKQINFTGNDGRCV